MPGHVTSCHPVPCLFLSLAMFFFFFFFFYKSLTTIPWSQEQPAFSVFSGIILHPFWYRTDPNRGKQLNLSSRVYWILLLNWVRKLKSSKCSQAGHLKKKTPLCISIFSSEKQLPFLNRSSWDAVVFCNLPFFSSCFPQTWFRAVFREKIFNQFLSSS
jgi:hypothetical protein